MPFEKTGWSDQDTFGAYAGDLSSPPYRQEAARLRQELIARNVKWAEENGYLHERTIGSASSVLYRAHDDGRHGNFHAASYKAILRNSDWSRRLSKTHTTARRHLLSHDPERKELDSCNSSDALLMNVFCHPSSSARHCALRSYLSVASIAPLDFGYKPRILLKTGHIDRTELDLRIGDLMIEAKLTESDFQVARWELAQRYQDFEVVFDPDLLPRQGEKLRSYQLVRGVLAAFADGTSRYCLICDDRRRDLIELWQEVLAAIRFHHQRWRCVLVTWQELSQTLPRPLQIWLQHKYGIVPPMLISRMQERHC